MSSNILKKDPYLSREASKYLKPVPSREYILAQIKNSKRNLSYKDLIEIFKLDDQDMYESIRRRLIAMCRDGQLVLNKDNTYSIVDTSHLVRGSVISHRDGYGFVLAEDGGKDIFLNVSQMKQLFPDDHVLVRLTNTKRSKREGVVVNILERRTSIIIGFYKNKTLIPTNKNITQTIKIVENTKLAKDGELIEAKIIKYPTKHKSAEAKIIESLGSHMDPEMEITISCKNHGIPTAWPKEIEHEIKQLKTIAKKNNVDIARKDLRKLNFITIDGSDAKDFDDAVYCKKVKTNWKLYVAIADVSHFVKPESIIDMEAYLRGNSVYFPNRVIPMLPEILSNHICSLKQNVDRKTMVCEITINPKGRLLRYEFYESTIKSKARLTYSEVSKALKKGYLKNNSAIMKNILDLEKLFNILFEARKKRGAIEFETSESKILFDKNKKIKQIKEEKRTKAHRIIEECMLAANVCAARFLLKHKIPALFRVHSHPNEKSIENLNKYLKNIGYSIPNTTDPKPKDFTSLIEQTKNRKDSHIIQTIILKSMHPALYDAENVGHFGLAYEAYGHFTSPIRRYPDLLTHRAIRHIIYGGKPKNYFYNNRQIHQIGDHCSMTERRADNAVYESIEWLKCEFMQDKLGEKYNGIVTNVTRAGLFIELGKIYIEGFLPINSLPKDQYKFDQISYKLIGKRSNKKYSIGDKIKIVIASVNLYERKITLSL